MAQTTGVISKAESLSLRLDSCWLRLQEASSARAYALVYAGFLSDVVSGGIQENDPEVSEMLQLVDEFCALVEFEPTAH
jgi:hypothetical protein